MKISYLIEPKDRIYVNGYGVLPLSKKIGKNVSGKCNQKLLRSAKRYTIDALKTASKRAIQKLAEATGDLIGNKLLTK